MENSEILFEMLNKLDSKLDSHTDTLTRLEVKTEENRKDINYHIKRTDLLEEQVKLNKKCLEDRVKVLEEPGQVSKFLSSNIIKYSGIIAACYGIVNFVKYLKSLI